MIKVLIADDEPLAREELKIMIDADPEFKVVKEAASGGEALRILENNEEIDLVFLDIQMPVKNGLDIASEIAEWDQKPHIVFATAYHQYAIEAFEANAIDYITKPFMPERVKKTLERIKKIMRSPAPKEQKLASLTADLAEKGLVKRLFGHEKNKRERIFINLPDVYYFYIEYSYVMARLASQRLIVNFSLRELLAFVKPPEFAQIHRGYIVNLNKVNKIESTLSGNYKITLKDLPETVPLSRRYVKSLKELMGRW